MDHPSPQGPCCGTMEGVSFSGDFDRQVRSYQTLLYGAFCELCKRRLYKWASLYRSPTREPGGGLVYWEL